MEQYLDCMFYVLSCSVVSDSLQPYGLQHARLPCPSPSPGVHSNSCPSSQRWHPTISSSVVSFSSCLQSFPASRSFSVTQLFLIRWPKCWSFSFSIILLMSTQGWFPLGLTGLILQPKGLSRVFLSNTIRKHQFFGSHTSLWSNSHTHTWLLEKPYLWLDGSLLIN